MECRGVEVGMQASNAAVRKVHPSRWALADVVAGVENDAAAAAAAVVVHTGHNIVVDAAVAALTAEVAGVKFVERDRVAVALVAVVAGAAVVEVHPPAQPPVEHSTAAIAHATVLAAARCSRAVGPQEVHGWPHCFHTRTSCNPAFVRKTLVAVLLPPRRDRTYTDQARVSVKARISQYEVIILTSSSSLDATTSWFLCGGKA